MSLNLTTRFLRTDSTMQKSYQECARYAFFKFGLNWQPMHRSHHLTFGLAMHAAFEVFNTQGTKIDNLEAAMAAFSAAYDPYVPEDVDAELAPKNKTNARKMLEMYCQRFSDASMQVLQYDGKPLVEVYSNIVYTMETAAGPMTAMFCYKMDVVKTNGTKIFVHDYKTSSKQMQHLQIEYDLDSQMINYNLALASMFKPELIGGAIINVLFFRKGNAKGERGLAIEPVQMSIPIDMYDEHSNGLIEWKRRMVDDAIRADAEYDAGKPLSAFPRNFKACFNWGRTCEFYDVCRFRNDVFGKKDDIPSGLKVEIWSPGGQNEEIE